MHLLRLSGALIFSLITLCPHLMAQEDDEDIIPPEILEQMDPDIRSDSRPVIHVLEQSEIFGLRNDPNLDADLVKFGFHPDKISSIQREIIVDWAKEGYNKIEK
jgi:hypothetical protein